MTDTAYIYEAIRTPRGKGNKTGSLQEVKPVALLGGLLGELSSRHGLDTSRVDDVVIGCVTPVGEQGGNIGKIATLFAGWSEQVAGMQLNRYCASGLEAVNLAAMKIASGWEGLVVAGGVESMSRVPMASDGGAWFMDPETNIKTAAVPQGIGADVVATLDGVTREDVDNFALNSQKKAAAAQAGGYFDRSVVPVKDRNDLIILARDEFLRPQTTMQALAGLKPSFRQLPIC